MANSDNGPDNTSRLSGSSGHPGRGSSEANVLNKRLPALGDHVRQQAYQHISQHITLLLDSCDDLFYDLSSRATNNQEQTLYFESMREIRIKRQDVQVEFQQLFNNGFTELLDPIKQRALNKKLALVHNDELEVDVALMNMFGRANDVYREDLHDLHTRLNHLIPAVAMDNESSPLAPERLCRTFASACQSHLEINIKPLIILLKQFERFVLKRLGQTYSESNQLLIEAGILPRIDRKVTRSRSANKPSQPNTPNENSEDELVDEVMRQQNRYGIPLSRSYDSYQSNFSLNEFSSLLEGARQGSYEFPHYTSHTANPGPLMPVSELIKLLNKAQEILNKQGQGDAAKPYLHKVTNKLLSSKDPKEPQAVSDSSDDVINLVAMFFEFILDDTNIALALRNQISRLQIPILKLALRDGTFFSDQAHPARHLINTIAAVGVIYDEDRDLTKDKVFLVICDIVQTICHQYTFDDNIFHELLPQLEKVIDKEQHRSAIIEKRTSQTEIGKSQVKLANKTARAFLVKRLHKMSLPGEIRDFLIERWLNVMIMTLLKCKEESQEWQESMQVVDNVLWCCQPDKDDTAKKRQQQLMPGLTKQLRAGLKMLGEQDSAIDEDVAMIKDIISSNAIIEASELSSEQELNLAKTPEPEGETAIQRQQQELKGVSFDSMQRIDNIKPGDWIRYVQAGSNKVLRCKLSAKIKSTDTLLFVNRFGLKVIEIDRRSFAYDLQHNRASLITNVPFFDRILDKMFDNIKVASAPA